MEHQTKSKTSDEIGHLRDSNNILKILIVITAVISIATGYTFGASNNSQQAQTIESSDMISEQESRLEELESENSDLKDSLVNINDTASDGLFAAENGVFDEMVSSLEDIEQESSK